ncbi:MAG UNVERIFIED_CONTAM: hypothetical protein LVR29_05205 [Microcystis novacekii LVE1205-3]
MQNQNHIENHIRSKQATFFFTFFLSFFFGSALRVVALQRVRAVQRRSLVREGARDSNCCGVQTVYGWQTVLDRMAGARSNCSSVQRVMSAQSVSPSRVPGALLELPKPQTVHLAHAVSSAPAQAAV